MIGYRNLLEAPAGTSLGLPRIFPRVGPATFDALFGDLAHLPNPVPTDAWQSESDVIEANHLAGLAVNRLVGVEIADGLRSRLRGTALLEMAFSDITAHSSSAALRLLEKTGVDYVVIKGPGISDLEGGSVARPFSDIDVLVRPGDFGPTLSCLRQAGFAERTVSAPTWEYFNRRCREAVNLRSDDGGSIDLHHRVSPWLWSSALDFSRLSAQSRHIDFSGVAMPAVSPVHNLLVCALHVVSDHGQAGVSLRPWRDLVFLAAHCDPDEVVREAELARLGGWLTWILESLPSDVRPHDLYHRVKRIDSSIPARRRLELLLPPHVGSSHLIGQALRLPAGNAAMFLAGMFLPSRRFLEDHYPEGGRYLRWWKDSTSGLRAAGQA